MNQIAKFHDKAMSVEDLNRTLAESRGSQPQGKSAGHTLLRMNYETGIWAYGQEDIEPEEGSLWSINPYRLETGWVWWADISINKRSQKMGEVMGLYVNPVPMPTTTFDHAGGEWKAQVGVPLVCINGEDAGQEVLYRNNSNGAVKAYEQVFDDVQDRPENDFEFPIVELTSSSYVHSGYKKKIFEPVFKVVDWCNRDQELLSLRNGSAPAVEAPKVDPAPTEPTSEPQAEAPRRRRRRSVK